VAQGNRGFADGLAGAVPPPAAGTRLPPRTGILGGRENRLAELASGASVTRVQELVDPARCRIWDGHNRDYTNLDEHNCADLIESFKAQGRQEVPAIVRRVTADPAITYEVICGARRHWTVAWLRAHDYPDFKFLVEARELTDEEAFRVADLENRNRRDLSDFERATDYGRAAERYYGGSQQRMAERLSVTKSWLSRYLELAKLPAEILAAFGSPHVIGISHGAALAPVIKVPEQRVRVLDEAMRLVAEQTDLVVGGQPALTPAIVLHRLLRAAKDARPVRGALPKEHVVRNQEGVVVARGQRAGRGGGITIAVPNPSKHERLALNAALEEIISHFVQAGAKTEETDR
jgi:ParB family chromosome partitioning protein